MEPIRLWRWFGALKWRNRRGLPSDIEYAALPRAEFDALVKEKDDAVKYWSAIADEVNEISGVLIEDGTEGRAESTVDAVRVIIKERDAATARAEKAEADQRALHFLQAAAKNPGNADLLRAMRDLGCDEPAGDPVAMVFLLPRAFPAPTDADRRGEGEVQF